MKKKKNIKKIIDTILLVSLLATSLAGCTKDENVDQSVNVDTVTENTEATSDGIVVTSEIEKDQTEDIEEIYIGNVLVSKEVKEKIDSMSIEEKVCQMMMPCMRYWYDTPDDKKNVENLNSEQYELLKEYNFGGLCLFSQNCTSTEQIVRLTSDIQKAAGESNTSIPMLISIDQEGGYVTRVATGTAGVGNMALAASNNPDNARIEASIIGEELNSLGININFGPDTDVNNNPNNPVIGVRSFSDNPEIVSVYAASYIDGLHDNKIMSCIKHFPGHGDTSTDSHVGLPYIDKSLEELYSQELIPFSSLKDSTDMIMTAHIQFPQIETERYTSVKTGEEVYLPATMSKSIITDILRNEIGYSGVVSTDALDMSAIAENFELLDVVKYSINADVDILLMPVKIESTSEIENMKKFISDVVNLVETGEISEEQINDSVARILNLKEKYNLEDRIESDTEKSLEIALQTVGSKEHHDEEWELAIQAVTEYKNDLEEFEINDDTKILYICPWDSQLNSFEIARQRLINDGIISENQVITTKSYDGIESDISKSFKEDIKNSDLVILVSRASSLESLDYTNPQNIDACFISNILLLSKEADKKTVFISSQLPYDAPLFDADAVYLVYNPAGASEVPEEYNGEVKKYGPNLPAAIYTVLSKNKASGSCPVNLEF